MNRLNEWGRRLLGIVIPERCVCCGELVPTGMVCCDACRETLPVIQPPTCARCGQQKKDCRCTGRRAVVDRAVAPFYYENSARQAVLHLKRNDQRMRTAFLASMMHTVIRREYDKETIDGIVFVPMTKRAQRIRGYNQSELLAQELSKQMEIPLYPVLTKLYETPPQKTLGLMARSGNVLGVFDVTDRNLRDKTLLLVDDLLTTGMTLQECAKMLKIYGARRVLAVTVAIRRNQKENG